MKKWMSKGIAALLAAVMLVIPAVSAAAATSVQEEELKIAVLSDTHYLSPDMIKDTEDFQKHLNSDRKMFAESSAFLTAMLDTIAQDDPDVLLISGDLTKDGEKQNHEELAEILEQFEQDTGILVYVVPGNHDINNSNGVNFNTEDGVAVAAERTTQQDFREIYADLIYNDETVIATFTPSDGKQGGGLSYVARPKDGFTIIAIDSARYSADNTDSGEDEHETSGAISEELESWIVEQIEAATLRGDTVIGLQHHGVVPHFEMEAELMPDFLVNDYERLAQVYADAGMAYIFTGHMHANDIASVTTESGNTLYDIETGSLLTYPSPARSATLTRVIDGTTVNETMRIKTYTGVGPVTFTNPLTGEEQTIEDISAYGKENGFTSESVAGMVNKVLNSYYEEIAETGSKTALETLISDLLLNGVISLTVEQIVEIALPFLISAVAPDEGNLSLSYDDDSAMVLIAYSGEENSIGLQIPEDGIMDSLNCLFDSVNALLAEPEVLDSVIEAAIEDVAAVVVSQDEDTDKTILDYANFIYQSHLGGEDSLEQPQWVIDARAYLASGELTDILIDILISHVTNLLNIVLDAVDFSDFTGIVGVDNADGSVSIVYDDSRTPLLIAADTESETLLGSAILSVICNEDSEIPDGYTLKNLLDDLSPLLAQLGFGEIDIDLETLLQQLINGDSEEEGLVTAELRAELTEYIGRIADTMGTDSNYTEDNDTVITRTWTLPAGYTAGGTASGDGSTSTSASAASSSGSGSATSPKTGNSVNILLWMLALDSAAAVVIVMCRRGRKTA